MTVTHSSLYDTAVGLSGRVVASLHPQSDQIIVLTLSDSNPQLATDILSTIISAYNENSLKERAEIAEATSRFINDRLNVIEQELGSVESNISSFVRPTCPTSAPPSSGHGADKQRQQRPRRHDHTPDHDALYPRLHGSARPRTQHHPARQHGVQDINRG